MDLERDAIHSTTGPFVSHLHSAIKDVVHIARLNDLQFSGCASDTIEKALSGVDFEGLVSSKLSEALVSAQLIFMYPPRTNSSPYPSVSSTFQGNWGRSALVENHPSNEKFLVCLRYLLRAIFSLDRIKEITVDRKEHFTMVISDALWKLDVHREKHWRKLQYGLESGDKLVYDTSPYILDYSSDVKTTIYWCSALITAVNIVFNTDKSTCNLLLKSIATLLQRNMNTITDSHAFPINAALFDFPTDVRSARKLLDIEPELIIYICCQNCFAIYLSSSGNQAKAADERCPPRCTHRPTPSSHICNESLFKIQRKHSKRNKCTDAELAKPMKTFAYQSFKAWFGRFLCRPRMEEYLDVIWSTCYGPVKQTVSDVWEAEEVRSFKGPDGRLFGDCEENEGRYFFSLFVDFFNPYGNKQAGKSSSSGVIFMACLNLPIEMRYRPENIYLAGIIPGPRSPSGEQINHLMNPLVAELSEFWDPGVKYLKTNKCPDGKLVRCALLMFISDLGARKTVGLASHAHTYFCSYDQLPLYRINNLDMSKWPRFSSDEFSQWANKFRWAPSEGQREATYKLSGIGWSPLQRLKYFDVTKYTVVDAMHNLFLGLIQVHVRDILGMTIKGISDDQVESIIPDQEAIQSTIRKILDIKSTPESLQKTSKLMLQILCRIYGESDTGNKLDLATRLIRKRTIIKVIYEQKIDTDIPVSDYVDAQSSRLAPLLAGDVLQELRGDIEQTLVPSWMARAPKNIGEASHGKLSADEWRTLATVHLPITLIRLWTRPNGTERQNRALTNFMHLFCALVLGTARTTSTMRSSYYTRFMLSYLRGLLDPSLYDDVTLKPNHHIALHLEEFLNRFGPTHSYWTFPFERYIGLLRKMKTNFKHDQLEITLLKTFTMAANLKSIMISIKPPSNEMKKLHKLLVTEMDLDTVGTGTFVGELRGLQSATEPIVHVNLKNSKRLIPEVYSLLLKFLQKKYPDAKYCHENDSLLLEKEIPIPNLAESVQRIQHRGVQYAVSSAHKADSRVCVRCDGETWYAACIMDIFIHARRLSTNNKRVSQQESAFAHSAFALVKKFLTFAEGQIVNPYAQYSLLRSRMISTKLSNEMHVVPFSDIVCHLACCPVADEVWVKDNTAMVVLCLDRE